MLAVAEPWCVERKDGCTFDGRKMYWMHPSRHEHRKEVFLSYDMLVKLLLSRCRCLVCSVFVTSSVVSVDLR